MHAQSDDAAHSRVSVPVRVHFSYTTGLKIPLNPTVFFYKQRWNIIESLREMQNTHNIPSKDPISAKTISTAYSASMIIFTAVLVPIFIQKSHDKSALELLALLSLAELGIILTTTSAVAVYFRDRQHQHFLRKVMESRFAIIAAGLPDVGFITYSSYLVGQKSPDMPPEDPSTDTIDSQSIALRQFQIGKSGEHMRVLVKVVNTTESPVAVDAANFSYSRKENLECFDSELVTYRLENSLAIASGKVVDATLSPSGSPLEGFYVTATGSMHLSCGKENLDLEFPANLELDPNESKYLAIDLPNVIKVVDMKKGSQTDDLRSTPAPNETFRPVNVWLDLTAKGGVHSNITIKVRHDYNFWACLNFTVSGLDDSERRCPTK